MLNTGDPELPPGSPSCQWQNPPVPSNTHSTIWFTIEAPANGLLTITTCGGLDNQDTVIALYEGTCGNLTEIFCAEDDCGFSGYLSTITATDLNPGETYYLMIGSPGGWTGSIPGEINIDITSP